MNNNIPELPASPSPTSSKLSLPFPVKIILKKLAADENFFNQAWNENSIDLKFEQIILLHCSGKLINIHRVYSYCCQYEGFPKAFRLTLVKLSVNSQKKKKKRNDWSTRIVSSNQKHALVFNASNQKHVFNAFSLYKRSRLYFQILYHQAVV